MKNSLLQKIRDIAKKKRIEVEVRTKKPYEVNFYSPDGYCFEKDLHCCINSAWDDDTHEDVEKGAMEDLKRLKLQLCDKDCDCRCIEPDHTEEDDNSSH